MKIYFKYFNNKYKLFNIAKIITLIFLVLIIYISPVHAQEYTDISCVVTYEIQRDGKTKVNNDITITNLNSIDYVKDFSLNIFKYKPEDIVSYEDNIKHNVQLITNDSKSTIFITFSNDVYGMGNKRNFKVEFMLDNLAVETGQIWELTIPKLENPSVYSNYNAIISIPKSMGKLAYISPSEDSFEEDEERNYYVFSKDKISSESVTAGFGEFQVFKFELNYHVENETNKNNIVDIALPPDTSTQIVSYESIDPVPLDVSVDSDGNWIASFQINKRSGLDIKANGYVQIFSAPRRIQDISEEVYENNIKSTIYWQSDNEKIKTFASKLWDVNNIFEFTKNTLSYNYSKVNSNIERLGALNALENPENSICMEFTDLFIALARAQNIPAREINGYAYTENPELQPLSLVADVLHSWPEYWDNQKKVWVPVDPTWGSTSNLDYFNIFDLRHFAFVIHGNDPDKPYSPGSYKNGDNPQKDIFIEFSEIKEIKNSDLNISYEKHFNRPFKKGEVVFNVYNSGPKALYSLSPKVYFDNQLKESRNIEVLPPFSYERVSVDVKENVLMNNFPEIISFTIDNKNIDVNTNKNIYILINLTLIASILVILLIFFYTKVFKKPNSL